MQATIPARLFRNLTFLLLASSLGACSWEGDGPTRIAGTPAPEIPPGFCDVINFENLCGPFTLQDFAGGATQIVDNPDKSGLNTSDKVVRMWKFDPGNGETFGGTKLALNGPVDFSKGEAFTMKVWASRSVPVLFKLEPGALLERTRNHSGSGAWEELCFDFPGGGTSGSRTDITVIFDLGVIGNAATDPANWTFFFDEIDQVADCGVPPAPTVLPVNFEGAGPYVFDDFGGAVASVVVNPVSGGINTSTQVAQMRKFSGEVFAGSTLQLAEAVNFSRGPALRMKVWSSRAVPVLFKFEGLNQERTVSHAGGSAWQQLCFDFTGSTAGPATSAITLIFDNGVAGDAENNPGNWTFYFDDIEQVANCGGGGADPGIIPDAVVYASDPNVTVNLPPPVVDDLDSGSTFDFFFTGDADFNPALRVRSGGDTGGGIEGNIVINGGFETGTFDGWQQFENSGVLNIVTNNPSSGTYAANLVVPVRGLPVTSADPLIKNANLQAGNLTPGAEVTVSFDMRGSLSGAGGVVFAELFSELAGEGTSKAEILSGGPLEPTAGWTTYTFNATLGPDVSGGVSLQLKASCGPVEGCGVDAFFDNVSIVIGTGGGSGAGGVALADSDVGANVGLIVLTGYAPGFAAGFETFDFKVKGLPTSTIEVRFLGGGDTSKVYNVTTYAGSTALGNGWYQLSIPLTDFAATIASNQGFLLGPLGEQARPFSFLLTDIGFSGTAGGGGGAGPGIVPHVVIFSSSAPPDLVFGVDYTGFDPFGSGSVFDNNVTTDPDFSPAFGVTTGDGYTVQVGQFGIVGFQAGFASSYETLDFKAKGLNNDIIRVKFLNDGDYLDIVLTASAFSTDLGNDWYQVSIPLTSVTGVDTATALLFETDNTAASAFTFLLTDLGFSGTAGGGGEVGDNIVINGGFETGTFEGWDLFPGGGVQAIVTDNPSSGTYVANLVVPVRGPTDAGMDNLIKSSNLEAGNLTPGAVVTVSFDMRGTLSGAGGVVFAELFSERSGGGTSDSKILGGEPLVPTAGWTTYSFTATLGSDVSGGVTLQLKTSCGPVEGCGVAVFFDNVSISIGGGVAPPPPVGNFPTITFDDSSVTYTLTDFGGNASVITNDPTGGSNQVVQIIRGGGAQDRAGTTVSTLADLAVPVIPFTATETRMTVRVYSPDEGIPVVLKVEDVANDTIFVETLATTTVANEWEILTFDFASPRPGTPSLNLANTYNKLSIFFNFGVTGEIAGEKIYYFDDIAFGGDVGDNFVINGGFETGTFEGWETLPGGGIQRIVTDNPSSGTYAANLIVPVRTQADPAVDNLLKNSNLQAGNLTPGATVTISFDMRGTLSGAGGVVFAEFFSERAGEGTSKSEILGDGPLALNAGWTTYRFTTTLGPDVGGGVTLLLKASCGPVEGCGVDVFFDNVSIVSGTVGGGGGDDNGGGGVWDGGGIAVNGGFETGTFEGWEQIEGGGIQTIVTDDPSSGTYAARLFVPERGSDPAPADTLIKNANLEAGNLTPGASVTVSFDMRGTLSGDGGVVFAELFSELAGEGTSKSEILGGVPLAPRPGWRKYSFDTTLGPDVGGGVTLLLKASCGPVEGCGVDAFFDNVSIVIN